MNREDLIKEFWYIRGVDDATAEKLIGKLADFCLDIKDNSKKAVAYNIDWIQDWLNIFPKGVKTGPKLVRSDKSGCLKKMLKFRKEYPEYDVTLIFKATENYVEELAENDYMYMKAATYFIDKKDEGSELAARCEDLLDRQLEDKINVKKQSNYFV